ncbi:MAG: AAA family ATPase [Ilumatobacteraceae bacterium]
MVSGPIGSEVQAFVSCAARELAALSGRAESAHDAEAVAEAANLVAAVLAADGRCTDDELWAYVESVGALLDPPLTASPTQLRESRLFVGKDAWLARPSALFELLVASDARSGTTASHRYYDAAMRLAHLAASLDLVPSSDEIAAIDRLRGALLVSMDEHGVARPGARPGPSPHPPGATPAAAATDSGSPSADQETPAPPREPVVAVLAELDELIGLDDVKAEVRRLTSLLQIQQLRAERGLPTYESSHHLVFTGNPGTGKTTIARLLSRIYHSLGLVTRGHLVETDRSALVAGYVGQTATKTRAVLDRALGGTLIIDEAYALARGGENDFGREAIDTLVKFMEDHRDDLAIVVAGYPDEMKLLIDANPGLASRSPRPFTSPTTPTTSWCGSSI